MVGVAVVSVATGGVIESPQETNASDESDIRKAEVTLRVSIIASRTRLTSESSIDGAGCNGGEGIGAASYGVHVDCRWPAIGLTMEQRVVASDHRHAARASGADKPGLGANHCV